MHGLINRSIQSFVIDTYGAQSWRLATAKAEIGFENFEAMLVYDDDLSLRLLDENASTHGKNVETILEDLGTYLVSHKRFERLRRLLRFGGRDFLEFLFSLDELRDRTQLAVPDFDMPDLSVSVIGEGQFRVRCDWAVTGFAHVLIGVLRTMADDYGDLVFLEFANGVDVDDAIEVTILEQDYAQGRDFQIMPSEENNGCV